MKFLLILLPITIGIIVGMLVRYLWPKSGKWGVNLKWVYCPKCGAKSPSLRSPKTWQEALWGGWHCKSCGCIMDKYGIDPSQVSK